MRLVETRLLEGPNVYRLEPVVKLEVAVGRRRTWFGQRDPGRHALVHLGAAVPVRDWPDPVAATVGWIRRLRADHGEGRGGVAVHRSSDPGHWIVTFPWVGAERALTLTDAALALAERDVSSARHAHLTGAQERQVARWAERIAGARATPPEWVRDRDRTVPIVSVSGTNGKSTVTRLITHILLRAGRRVGTTTSDGVLVDERMVDPGDWTGPGGAHQILARRDIEVAVLETARGGIVLRGVGYESNDASVLTNVSSDHLDLQGIHTLPELAEVKSTICRITRADGWVVLNADDALVAAVARRVRARVALFTLDGDASAAVRRHRERGGRAYLVRDGALVEADGAAETAIVDVADVPITIGGLARHNVANALAAAGGARGLGATIADVRDGLSHFAPDAERSPGRLNLYRLGSRVVIVDFAHNEAGMAAVLDVAQGIAAGAAGRAAPITAIIGTAGDRPDDTLRGIGRIAAERAQRVAIKQTLKYLRGRTAESVVGELMAGIVAGGGDAAEVPIYRTEPEALQAELNGAAAASAHGGRSDAARVVVLMCHEDRDGVFELVAPSRREAGRRGLGADRARPPAAGPAQARLGGRRAAGALGGPRRPAPWWPACGRPWWPAAAGPLVARGGRVVARGQRIRLELATGAPARFGGGPRPTNSARTRSTGSIWWPVANESDVTHRFARRTLARGHRFDPTTRLGKRYGPIRWLGANTNWASGRSPPGSPTRRWLEATTERSPRTLAARNSRNVGSGPTPNRAPGTRSPKRPETVARGQRPAPRPRAARPPHSGRALPRWAIVKDPGACLASHQAQRRSG